MPVMNDQEKPSGPVEDHRSKPRWSANKKMDAVLRLLRGLAVLPSMGPTGGATIEKQAHTERVEDLLDGTLYSFDLAESQELVRAVSQELRQLGRRVRRYHERVEATAGEARVRLDRLQRARLMVESSRIEGIDVDFKDTLAAIESLEDATTRAAESLSMAVAGDEHIAKALGLARAHQLGDDLARGLQRPLLETELRGLHAEICLGEPWAGRMREGDIRIGGAPHRPPPEAEMREEMPRLLNWFNTSRGRDPLVVAAATHTWLAHLHPFEDGNGRLARLLANMALARDGWPPVVIRSGPSKYEYYSALARSDEAGELLPVIALFMDEAKRSLKEWEAPDAAIAAIETEMVESHGHEAWCVLAAQFVEVLRMSLQGEGVDVELAGLPGRADFEYLKKRSPSGNGWLATVRSRGTRLARPVDLLIWFGYHSDEYLRSASHEHLWPSLYFSTRATSPGAVHPYRSMRQTREFPLNEVVLRVGLSGATAAVRSGGRFAATTPEGAAELFRDAVMSIGDDSRRQQSHLRRIHRLLH
jgi:Fic family protein